MRHLRNALRSGNGSPAAVGLALFMLLGLAASVWGAAPRAEPEEPHPTPAVQQLLNGALQKLQQKDLRGCEAGLNQALAVARKAGDLPGEAFSHWMKGIYYQSAGEPGQCLTEFRTALALYKREGEGPPQASLLLGIGRMLAAEQPEESLRLARQAADLGKAEIKRPLAMAGILNNAGALLFEQGLIRESRVALDAAAYLKERHNPNSEDLANTLSNLANAEAELGDVAPARQHLERALALYLKIEAESPDVARVRTNLGLVLQQQGELRSASEQFNLAVRIMEQKAPGSPRLASCLNNLGASQVVLGAYPDADKTLGRALAIEEKQAGAEGLGVDAALTLDNLGLSARHQGRLLLSRAYLVRALRIRERVVPGTPDHANSLGNLGATAWMEGDLEGAETYADQAVRLLELRLPGSSRLATALHNLGMIRLERGNRTGGREVLRRALELHLTIAPRSSNVVLTLLSLGNAALADKDPGEAERLFLQGLKLLRSGVSAPPLVGPCLNNLGVVNQLLKKPAEARRYLAEALVWKEQFGGETLETARTLDTLASLANDDGEVEKAVALAGQAWNIVRDSGAEVAGDEGRQLFSAGASPIAASLIEYQLRFGKPAATLRTLDEAHAQSLRREMNSRPIVGSRVPAALWSAYAQSKRGEQEAGEELARAAAAAERGGPAAAVQEARRKLTQLRLQSEQRWQEVQAAAPELFMPAGSAPAASEALAPGTLFIGFMCGEKATLMVTARGGEAPAEQRIHGYTLPLGEDALRERIREFRRQVTGAAVSFRGAKPVRTVGERTPGDRLREASGALYRDLFPAEARSALAGAKQVVLAPDGPLWDLPFAALVTAEQPAADASAPYLGLRNTLVYTQSLSLFLEATTKSAPRREPLKVLCLGNPLVGGRPTPTEEGTTERGLLFDGEGPPPSLPEAEREAVEVARLYGAEALTGADATETALRRRAGEADIIHLATHGFLNPYRSLSSGLLLAPEPGEPSPDRDGALQAWEVADQLRLKADLVVLSACETGLGAKAPGEGLVGLTRAFQIAGARTVIASQWKVADAATGTLMVHMHQALREGIPKAEALRKAMADVARDPRTSHPYFWAPFVLVGDPGAP